MLIELNSNHPIPHSLHKQYCIDHHHYKCKSLRVVEHVEENLLHCLTTDHNNDYVYAYCVFNYEPSYVDVGEIIELIE